VGEGVDYTAGTECQDLILNPARLLAKRVVCHNGTDPRSRPYDMLRTQVLQAMDLKGWKIIGVTSPTPGCGKTLTALNLGLSIARQPERSVMLADFDLRKPHLAKYLELEPAEGGVLGILGARTLLGDAVIPVRVGNQRFPVLPTAATTGSSELIASRAMSELLREIRREFCTHIVIVDLPPVLTSDDVIAVLPQLDCVLLVTAAGLSKTAEIGECSRHLQSIDVVRVVLNKVTEMGGHSYYN
jgi:protein-tyrosine kinase